MEMRIFAAAAIVLALLLGFYAAVEAAEVKISDQPPQSITIRNVSVKDGEVSGEVVNSSSRPIRDVQLLIRYTWLWKNEMKPGEDTRSDAVFQTVEGEIPPGGSKPFTYRSSSATAGGDGRYDATVKIAGYTELIPAK
jgi:hypothetical protein